MTLDRVLSIGAAGPVAAAGFVLMVGGVGLLLTAVRYIGAGGLGLIAGANSRQRAVARFRRLQRRDDA